MESPVKEIDAFKRLMKEGRQLLDEQKWETAKAMLEQAVAIDDLQPKPHELLAVAYGELGDPEQALQHRNRAKAMREEIWKREVEAEIRGQHEMLGEAARHEIP